ncbi:hypothetical protein C7S15_7233 [Burkholderia cepacia]|nr:hypothetical protein [Burkholderia cepacia]
MASALVLLFGWLCEVSSSTEFGVASAFVLNALRVGMHHHE